MMEFIRLRPNISSRCLPRHALTLRRHDFHYLPASKQPLHAAVVIMRSRVSRLFRLFVSDATRSTRRSPHSTTRGSATYSPLGMRRRISVTSPTVTVRIGGRGGSSTIVASLTAGQSDVTHDGSKDHSSNRPMSIDSQSSRPPVQSPGQPRLLLSPKLQLPADAPPSRLLLCPEAQLPPRVEHVLVEQTGPAVDVLAAALRLEPRSARGRSGGRVGGQMEG